MNNLICESVANNFMNKSVAFFIFIDRF